MYSAVQVLSLELLMYFMKIISAFLKPLVGEGNGNPLQYSCLENPTGRGPDRLQSMGSWRVGHDWVTSFHFSFSCTGEGNGNPLQYSCLENPREGGAWWAAVCGVAQSGTWLKQLSSSSSKAFSISVILLYCFGYFFAAQSKIIFL